MRPTVVASVGGIAAAVAVAALASAHAATATGPCRLRELRVSIGPLVSEKTEQHTVTIRLTNGGQSACKLDGYPVIALFDGRGRLLRSSYSHRGDQMITGARPSSFDLRPRRSAFVALNKNVCVTRTTRVASTVRLGLSATTPGRSLRLPRSPLIDYCPSPDPGATVTVSPFEPSLRDTACLTQRSCRRSP